MYFIIMALICDKWEVYSQAFALRQHSQYIVKTFSADKLPVVNVHGGKMYGILIIPLIITECLRY